ncbi:hypothetical protein D9M68_465000 [compost metagenome]
MNNSGGRRQGRRQGKNGHCDRTWLGHGTADLVDNDLEQQRQQKDKGLAAGVLAFEKNAGENEGRQPKERLVENVREC